MRRNDLVMGSVRELGTVALVAGLSGGYAAALVMAASFLSTMSEASGPAVGGMPTVVSTVFILIALYVAVVVMINCVDTVIDGRLRQVALLRLLGARAIRLRRAVLRSTASAGLLGRGIGAVLGTVAADLVRLVLVARGTMPGRQGDCAWVHPAIPVAIAAVTATAAEPDERRVPLVRIALASGLIAVGAADDRATADHHDRGADRDRGDLLDHRRRRLRVDDVAHRDPATTRVRAAPVAGFHPRPGAFDDHDGVGGAVGDGRGLRHGLGLVYGSVGAQSLLGAMTTGFVWGVPWPVLLGIIGCGTALVLVSSQIPLRSDG